MDFFDSMLYYHNISSEIGEGVVLIVIAEWISGLWFLL